MRWLIPFLLLTVACQAQQEHPKKDLWGHRYPERCRVMKTPDPIVIRYIDLGYSAKGDKRLGAYWLPGTIHQHAVIAIDTSIRDRSTQVEVMRHELCHHVMWFYTGNPDWH